MILCHCNLHACFSIESQSFHFHKDNISVIKQSFYDLEYKMSIIYVFIDFCADPIRMKSRENIIQGNLSCKVILMRKIFQFQALCFKRTNRFE